MALVLSRRVGEVVKIGTDIELMITGIEGNQVRLAFTAPKSVVIHRTEVAERIAAENAAKTV